MKVISKQMPGYSRYFIYSDGQVWDSAKQKFCKSCNSNGYLRVYLKSDNGPKKQFLVHRLIAEVFIPNLDPEHKTQVDHKDTIKTNNTVYINDDGSVNEELSNLHWVTPKENMNNPLTKERMSGENNPMYGKRGEDNPNYGKKRPEFAAKMSGENHPMYGKRGEDNPNYGKKRPDHAAKMSGENHPMYGKHRTDEFKRDMSKKLKGKPQNKQYCRNKITGRVTTSAWVNRWINQGKTTQEEWELIENS